MKRLLLLLAVAGPALLAPGLARAQEKPVLNSAPPAPVPVPVTPAPAVATPAPTYPADTVTARPAAPAGSALPPPTYGSPSGLDLPEREQKRQAAQQHADQFTKLFVYSGVGLGYTSYYGVSQFNFNISPAIGYRVTERFSIGPGISYSYNNYGQDTNVNTTRHVSASSLGVKVFAQLIVYKQFFLHAEYESTRAEFPTYYSNGLLTGEKASLQVQTPLAGIGYRSQISNRAAADILLLYNFKDNYTSIYPNPVVRFNFLFNIGH